MLSDLYVSLRHQSHCILSSMVMNTPCLKAFSLLACLLIVLPLSAQSEQCDSISQSIIDKAPDGYYITRMDVDMTVHADHSYDVVEDLRLQFVESRHGIYRSINNSFWATRDVSDDPSDPKQVSRYTSVKVDDIMVSAPFEVEHLPSCYDIRIGDPDRMVYGPVDYHISYRMHLLDDRITQSDQFYHSIVGDQWTCDIDTVSFVIHFDQPFQINDNSDFYGYVGDKVFLYNDLDDTTISIKDPYTVTGYYTGLHPYEGITLWINLPQGYFEVGETPIWYYLSWLMVIVCLVLICYLSIHIYNGDQKVTPVVTFEAPKGIMPAEVGVIVDGRVDEEDLMSMIPYMANIGLISIGQDQSGNLILHQLKPLPTDCPQYMKYLYEGWFANGPVFKVSDADKDTKFGEVWLRTCNSFQAASNKYLKDFRKYQLWYYALQFCFALLVCFARAIPEGWSYGAMTHGGQIVIAVLLYLLQYANGDISLQKSIKSPVGIVIYGFGALIFAGAVFVYILGISVDYDYYIPENIIFTLGALVFLIDLLYFRLGRMKEDRRRYLPEVLGLREFIQTAETDRLRMLLEKDERYFYNVLPYAVAFGTADKWIKKFDGLTVAPIAEFMNGSVSNVHRMVSPANYHTHFAAASSAAAVVAAQRRQGSSGRHSGGGSRGRSGGGSGGGGGRSW